MPPPRVDVVIPGSANAAVPMDPAVWTPEAAVERLLWLEGKGWKYHELRKRVVDMLGGCENPPSFVARCLELVAAERDRRRRAERAKQRRRAEKNGGEGDGGGRSGEVTADPIVHLLLECLPKASADIRETHQRSQLDVVVKRSRFVAAEDRAAALPLLLRSMAGYLDATREGIGQEGEAGDAILEPRAVIRLAETYGVDLADVEAHRAAASVDAGQSHGATSCSSLVETYVEALLREARYAPAVTTALHFSLRRFAAREVVVALISSQQFGLASDIAAAVDPESSSLRSQLVEACMETEEHSGYRAAWAAVREFQLHDRFPLVKQRYFESTIGRMVDKGQHEAALRYAGDDTTLQAAVVQRLVENGDAVTATEFAARCGMEATDLCSSEELARAARERRDAHLQLPDDVAAAIIFVDDEEGLKRAAEALSRAPIIGLDTEWAADLSKEDDGGGGRGRGGSEGEGEGGDGSKKSRSRKRERGMNKKKLPRGSGSGDGGPDKRDVADAAAIAADVVERKRSGGSEDDEAGPESEAEVRAAEEERSAAAVVALFQVATQSEVFLLDLPTLLTRCPHAMAPTLGAVLADPGVLKAGFGVAEDLRRLAVLHPAAFGTAKEGGPVGGVGPIIDLQNVWATGTRMAREAVSTAGGKAKAKRDAAAADAPLAGPWGAPEHYQRKHAVGLSHLSKAVLGKPLDKSVRMSDWSKRPLTQRQTHYAALDAWVLVEMMRRLRREHGEELERLVSGLTHTRGLD